MNGRFLVTAALTCMCLSASGQQPPLESEPQPPIAPPSLTNLEPPPPTSQPDYQPPLESLLETADPLARVAEPATDNNGGIVPNTPAPNSPAPNSPKTVAPVAPTGQLPWSSSDVQASPPTSPREMLELFDIGDSQLRSLFDGEPLGAADEETLVNLLFRFPRMGEENIFRWRREIPLEELAASPMEHRAAVAFIRGVVRKIEQRTLIPEIAKLYDFKTYWVLTVAPNDSEHEVLVCTRNIPPQWGDKPLDETSFDTAFEGFFLKTGSVGPTAQLVFAASRVQWRPKQIDPQRNIEASHVLLAKHGMDIGRFASLEAQNGKPLGSSDRTAFYEMLSAVRSVTTDEIKQAKPAKVDLRALLIEPKTIHGRLMRLQVRAARITRLEVREADIRDRYGVDHYYQIDAYLPLGEQSVRLGSDPEAPEYRNAFPVTLCLIDLPESMKDVDKRMASGESPSEVLDRELLTDAFFYRIWSYRSQFIDDRTPGKLQPAPMLLATGLQAVRPGGVDSDFLSLVFGFGFVSLLGIVCLTLWWTSRGDAAVEKKLQGKRFQLPGSLDELDVEGHNPKRSSQ